MSPKVSPLVSEGVSPEVGRILGRGLPASLSFA